MFEGDGRLTACRELAVRRSRTWSAASTTRSTQPRRFVPGETPIPVSGRVYDAEEMVSLVESALDFWLTSGRFARELEKGLARFVGLRHAILCNSGSSANLLALSRADIAQAGRSARSSPATRSSRLRRDSRRQSTRSSRTGSCRCSSTSIRRPATLRRRRRLREAVGPQDARGHDGPHARQPVRPRRGHADLLVDTTSGWSRTAATRSGRHTTASASARSATSRRCRSTPPTTSPRARAAAS